MINSYDILIVFIVARKENLVTHTITFAFLESLVSGETHYLFIYQLHVP